MRSTTTTSHPLPTAERETLTIAEMAELLGISRTVVYELAARDQLPVPTLRVGRQYRFSRRAFEELMQSQHATTSLADQP
jgi:excisionase family DNA binding protein